jgi:hypothetical protein
MVGNSYGGANVQLYGGLRRGAPNPPYNGEGVRRAG